MSSYYTALEQATGATRMQLGMLSSIYSIVNFIACLPGGYLADRVFVKNWSQQAVWGPLYSACGMPCCWALSGSFIIHMGFAITTVFIFRAAMVKAVNNLGTAAE
jgi:MFS family permease